MGGSASPPKRMIDIIFLITNVCALIVVFMCYILTLIVLVTDDDDMQWTSLIGVASILLSYVGYFIGCSVTESVFVKNTWIAANPVILLCFLIGIARRTRTNWIANSISLICIAAFGVIPFLSVSYKKTDWSLPQLQHDQNTVLLLGGSCIILITVALVSCLLSRTNKREKELRNQTFALLDELKNCNFIFITKRTLF